MIRISERILSLDENILAASLFSSQFHMVENAVKPGFEKRFRVTPAVERSGPSYAATIYGMAKLLEETFGDVERITTDHGSAKLMLLALKNSRGFVGLVLNKTVNSDLLALRISAELNEEDKEIDMLL
jgi:hypothetical protein